MRVVSVAAAAAEMAQLLCVRLCSEVCASGPGFESMLTGPRANVLNHVLANGEKILLQKESSKCY